MNRGRETRRKIEGESRRNLDEQTATVKKVTGVALATNVTLSTLKIAGGIYGNSQAVTADGIHSLSDCITDLILLTGVRYWSRPPDKSHPYGHKKIETIVAIVVGLFLVSAALGLAWNAIATIHETSLSPPSPIALAAAIISIFSKEALYRYSIAKSEKINSSALKANAWHQRSDAMSSIPVAISVAGVLVFPGLHFLDNAGAILVSVFILHAAWQVLRPNLGELADEAASPKTVEMIKNMAQTVEGVVEVHKVRTRSVGNEIHVDLHVLVDGKLTITQGHDIATLVQDTLASSSIEIADTLVHIEPDDNRGSSVLL